MSENLNPVCPECGDSVERPEAFDRRNFIRVVSAGAAAITAGLGALPRLAAEETKKFERPEKPAEALVKELFSTLSAEQKKQVVLPYDHKTGGSLTRRGMYNAAIQGKIGTVYDKKQQELVERILKAMSSGEEGYRCLTRNGTFDNSRSLENCGANIFGDPTTNQWAYLFTGHHLTVRCDGDSEPGAAFGGPMYYGHSPHGYSDKNIFFFQTKAVMSVYDALSAEQRKQAVIVGKDKMPGEQARSVQLKGENAPKPGIAYASLTKDQQELVAKVMREVLSPYRKEDADEVMAIIKETGGMEKINLAFYHDGEVKDERNWDFWRLEGPGFVWNYRVLPHVHTFVNISSKI